MLKLNGILSLQIKAIFWKHVTKQPEVCPRGRNWETLLCLCVSRWSCYFITTKDTFLTILISSFSSYIQGRIMKFWSPRQQAFWGPCAYACADLLPPIPLYLIGIWNIFSGENFHFVQSCGSRQSKLVLPKKLQITVNRVMILQYACFS